MTINCSECKEDFIPSSEALSNLEEVGNPNIGNHITSHTEEGTVYCPKCNHEIEIEYTYDAHNNTEDELIIDNQHCNLI